MADGGSRGALAGWRITGGAWALVVVLGVALYFNDPSSTLWSPKCPLFMLTGVKCPSCGTQRFLYHFAHGDFVTALRFNYFAPPALLYLALVGAVYLFPKWSPARWAHDVFATWRWGLAFLILYIVWGVARNILNL